MPDNGKVLFLRELEVIRESELVVYETLLKGVAFGYLYSTPKNYSFVWRGPSGDFQIQWPYGFIEHQFSTLSPFRINQKGLLLPTPRPRPSFILRYSHAFVYQRATATLLFGGDESYVEYDLLDSDRDREAYSEEIKHSESVVFARYDCSVQKDKQSFDCCITFEVLPSAESCEIAIKLPKDLPLSERALIWIIRNHQDGKLMHQVDLKRSLSELFKTLGQRPASVFSGEMS